MLFSFIFNSFQITRIILHTSQIMINFASETDMPIMKIKTFTLAGLAVLCLSACSGTEKTEETVADITAAQMMGREEARKYLNRPWKDTLELQRQLLQSRAKKSRYEMKNHHKQAEAYDSAFVKTLKTVRPELAAELEQHSDK